MSSVREAVGNKLKLAAQVVAALPENPSEQELWAAMFAIEEAMQPLIAHGQAVQRTAG